MIDRRLRGVAATALACALGISAMPRSVAAEQVQLAQAETAPRSNLPGGASSLQETYQDWQVACVQQDTGSRCVMRQQQINKQSGQQVVAIELLAAEGKLDGVLVLPFGLDLEKGAVLQIDIGADDPALRFRTCLPAGCVVQVSFDAKIIANLRKGEALKVKVVADGGSEAPLSISLKGFSPALDRVTELSKT
jgi:invasion protein IalB